MALDREQKTQNTITHSSMKSVAQLIAVPFLSRNNKPQHNGIDWASKLMIPFHPDIDSLKRSLLAAFPAAALHANPIVFGELSLRFELGDPHPNGSDARISQSTDRACQLYRDVFPSHRELMLVIEHWDSSGKELWPSDPAGYLYSLIAEFSVESSAKEILSDSDGDISHERLMFVAGTDAVDSRKIFQGIAHREQGRVPRINESVYFVDIANGVAFYMYDDRGCLTYFSNDNSRKALYQLRKDWLVRR